MVQEEREVHVVFGERHCSCLQAAELCWAPLVCWTGSLVGRMESELAEDGEGFPSLQVSAEVKGAAGGYWAWGSLFRSSLSQYQKQVKKFKESKGGQLNPLVFLFFLHLFWKKVCKDYFEGKTFKGKVYSQWKIFQYITTYFFLSSQKRVRHLQPKQASHFRNEALHLFLWTSVHCIETLFSIETWLSLGSIFQDAPWTWWHTME